MNKGNCSLYIDASFYQGVFLPASFRAHYRAFTPGRLSALGCSGVKESRALNIAAGIRIVTGPTGGGGIHMGELSQSDYFPSELQEECSQPVLDARQMIYFEVKAEGIESLKGDK